MKSKIKVFFCTVEPLNDIVGKHRHFSTDIKIKNYKIKISFVSSEWLRTLAKKTAIDFMGLVFTLKNFL